MRTAAWVGAGSASSAGAAAISLARPRAALRGQTNLGEPLSTRRARVWDALANDKHARHSYVAKSEHASRCLVCLSSGRVDIL